MPYLGDFIGQLMVAVTRARLDSDLESVRVAELYASHPYLKHFPVPRFRLPTLNISFPVVIQEVEEIAEGEKAPKNLTKKDVREETEKVLLQQLNIHKVSLSARRLTNMKRTLYREINAFERAEEVAVDVTRTSETVADRMVGELKKISTMRQIDVSAWRSEILSSLKIGLINRRKSAQQIKVLVETGQVKEAAPTEILAQFNLTVTEDAVEWTMVEIEGKEQDKLIPE